MKKFSEIMLALIAFASLSASAFGAANEEAASTVGLNESISRGEMLFNFDQAAWHSTDALVEKAGDISKLPIVGRIVIPVKDGFQAIYYGANKDGRFQVFSSIWDGQKLIDTVYSKGETGIPLSPQATKYAEVLELLTSGKIDTSDLWFCNKAQPNFVLLPGTKENEFLVYFMTAQEQTTRYPLGGHHRFDIIDGKVVSKRAFTKTCIDYDKKEAVKASGKKIVAFFVAHLLDPIPTELHVFTALASQSPIYVTTSSKKTWIIQPEGQSVTVAEVPAQGNRE